MNTTEASVAAQELAWFKSSYSGAEGGECLEVANATGAVHIRDSKISAGPVLTVSPTRGPGLSRWPATGRPEAYATPWDLPRTTGSGSHACVWTPVVRPRRPRPPRGGSSATRRGGRCG